jgi:hypothetical protein
VTKKLPPEKPKRHLSRRHLKSVAIVHVARLEAAQHWPFFNLLSNLIFKIMEDSIHSCQRSASDQFDIDIENAFAKISIIPNYPLLKEMSHQPNMPTRYETVGTARPIHMFNQIAQIRQVQLQ